MRTLAEQGLVNERRRWLNLSLFAERDGGQIYRCQQYWDGTVIYTLVAECPNEEALYAAKRLLGTP